MPVIAGCQDRLVEMGRCGDEAIIQFQRVALDPPLILPSLFRDVAGYGE